MNQVAFQLALVCLAASCQADAPAEPDPCEIVQPSTPLPAVLEESSGVTVSRAHPGVLWSMNDSGNDAVLYAVTPSGALVGSVEVEGARNHDWEDVALGPCGGAGDCLYVADTGNNDADRQEKGTLALYRLPEPDPATTHEASGAERFPFRYPDGEHDSEALFVLPSGQPFLVTKGRYGAVGLYRFPIPLRSGQEVELERVAMLTTKEPSNGGRVTGADASPDGRWVAIRSYATLSLYRADRLVGGDTRPALIVGLAPLEEAQGEGVALLDDGRVVLTSEAGPEHAPATLAILQCALPDSGVARSGGRD
ncbi:MAG TPA: hypothetical protein VFI96_05530 [Longimicrobiaceae bacterium]|nr:hypothetical protein [Longimicrobiaceae bacterium]